MKKRGVTALALMLAVMLVFSVLTPTSALAAAKIDEAQELYNVPDERVIKASDVAGLKKALKTAGESATKKKPYIVYAKSGTYELTQTLKVPENVILVGTGSTVFTTNENLTQLVKVEGSVYGGVFDGNGCADYCVRLADKTKYDDGTSTGRGDGNGWIYSAVIRNAAKDGVVAANSSKYGYLYDCVISGNGRYGVQVKNGSRLSGVNACTIKGNGGAGIYVSDSTLVLVKDSLIKENGSNGLAAVSSSVNTIKDTTVTANAGHGIFASSSSKISMVKRCTITKNEGVGLLARESQYGEIRENTVNYNQNCGMAFTDGSSVNSALADNEIKYNTSDGVRVRTSTVVAFTRNTISTNGGTSLSAMGEGTKVDMRSSNILSRAGEENLYISGGARVYVSGSSNVIKEAADSGITVKGDSVFSMLSGSNNSVRDNGGYGIEMLGTASVRLTNTTFLGNAVAGGYLGESVNLADYSTTNLTTADIEADAYLVLEYDKYLEEAKKHTSETDYLLLVNQGDFMTVVFKKDAGGDWVKQKEFLCCVGAPSTPTSVGTYKIGIQGDYFTGWDYRCWYYSQFDGSILFHSTLYAIDSEPLVETESGLGTAVSHGCVRLALENAKWIMDNIPQRTTVYSYNRPF